MTHFRYRDGQLCCDSTPLGRIAEAIGTPTYVYSAPAIVESLRAYDRALATVPHLIAYALKANSNLGVLALLARAGAGAEVFSGGELFRALRAGVPPKRIIFAGPGKTREEMAEALKAEILMFNVESAAELRQLDRVAQEAGTRAPVALRINPDVDPQTHPYIATGLKTAKFGIPIDQGVDAYAIARGLPGVEVVGVHMHIGSQLTKTAPIADAMARLADLGAALRSQGVAVRYLDAGGGLGIQYKDETPPTPQEYAQVFLPTVKDLGLTLILEPGRSIVGNAGVLLTRVLYLKDNGPKRFVVVDAAMNDLIRPSLYNAYHAILPVAEPRGGPARVVDVVGPICESGDFLAKDRELPAVEEGELLAVMSAGAYGFAMASNYNARPRPAEVLVEGARFSLVRRRETYEDLIAGEAFPD
ncbi:MAG: diaminopimelate decarboxylase [Candidatus Rokubacteria bacterium]|nr:diaminopimelate decarboxylase [Candidatus Rokubacteria bacterium]